MAKSRILKEKTASARGIEAQWPRWMHMAKTVPAMRLDKVRGSRKAIDQYALDSDAVLDITIERLSEELGLDDTSDGGEPVG